MRKFAIVGLLFLAGAHAADTGALTVTAKDSGGEPLKDVSVWLEPTRLQVPFNAAHSYYIYEKLDPDSYTVAAYSASRALKLIKTVKVSAGVMSALDFVFPEPSSIAGKVLDEDGKPLSRITVALLAAAYRNGSLVYDYPTFTTTDEDGEYTFDKSVQPGRAYRVVAYKGRGLSVTEPQDAKKRPSIVRPTYYPHAKFLDAANPVVVGVAEARENVDIVMSRTDSYCIAGAVEPTDAEVSGWASITLSDVPLGFGSWQIHKGEFHLCGLVSGRYTITAPGGTASVTIRAHDVTDVKLRLIGSQPLGDRNRLGRRFARPADFVDGSCRNR